MKDCIIIIPLYKYDLYDYEILSLNRILDLYGNDDRYDITYLISEEYDLIKLFKKYEIDKKYNIENFHYLKYNEYFFQSSLTYNKLFLNHTVYDLYYNSYKYLLIYQTDAYIFNDELDYWINKNYDYIGSYEGLIDANLVHNIDYLTQYNVHNVDINKLIRMNGGFSLRNLQSMYNLTNKKELIPFEQQVYMSADHVLEEDLFFSLYTNTLCPALDSIKFGYSHMYFSLSYSVNDFKYPFGCHAIHKSKDILNLIKQFNNENNLKYL